MRSSALIPDEVLERHHVLVGSDNAFQRRARLLQALWRQERGLPIGLHRGRPLGSRLESREARASLANFVSEKTKEVVRHAVLGAGRGEGQLIDEERLFTNLLSSQPLCFNLFGELSLDLELATSVFKELAPQRIERVTGISFEHSPGRGDARFTGDKSAFDVFATYDSPQGKRGFLGIEVKYHEALGDSPAGHRPRYDELADLMDCFVSDRAALRDKPLQQIWRDHLLSGALVSANIGYDEGAFVFLAPQDNTACAKAVADYRKHLTHGETFLSWSLEAVLDVLGSRAQPPQWACEVRDRYLVFERVDEVVRLEDFAFDRRV